MNAKLQGEWQERTVFGLTAETKWVADDAHNRNLIWCVLWFQITLKLTLPTAHYLSPTNLHLLHHRQAHGLVHLKLIYRDQINILPECHHGAEMLQGACTFRTLKPQRSWQYQTNNTLFLSYLLGRCIAPVENTVTFVFCYTIRRMQYIAQVDISQWHKSHIS